MSVSIIWPMISFSNRSLSTSGLFQPSLIDGANV